MRGCKKLTNEQWGKLQHVIQASKKADEVRRAQAIMLLNDNTSLDTITALTGYKRRQIYTLRSNYLRNGIDSIVDQRAGKPKELLTRKQREEIIETLKTKKPKEIDTYFKNYDYWTAGALGAYIKRTYDVAYKSKTSHYVLFKQARFTYHKPGRVSERQNLQEGEEWRKNTKKHITNAWHDSDTVIFVEDEMHLSNQTTIQKIWLPKGEYPRIEVARKREARSIYGFLNVKTGTEHAFKTKWQNMYVTAEILPKMRKLYPKKKILLLWDQAGWHKGSEAQKIIKKDKNIETLYFPTATPEENPQEHVWKTGRSHISHNTCMQDIDKTTDEFVEYLNTTRFPYELLGFSAGL
jgi:transposase